MTSEPLAPGAPAIILYRQVDRDDNGSTSHEDQYFKIKVLTEEGRKYADIEIPFDKDSSDIIGIHARTIRPDGTIASFDGKVYKKSVVKGKGYKYWAATFTLPDVQAGSIIEYYYTEDLKEHWIYDSHWILSNELFTKHGALSLKPYKGTYTSWNIRWSWKDLPPGTGQPKEDPQHVIRLDVKDVLAFRSEDYMPPEFEMKARVDFIYSREIVTFEGDKYWKETGKKLNGQLDSFIDKKKAMQQAAAGIVSASDSPEVKMQKIYSRVQEMRNTSYDVKKSDEEKARDKEKSANTVEDIWKRGYGNGAELTWLYLALVRGAGLEAYGVWASSRNSYFFTPNTFDSSRLNSNLVVVKVDGKEFYADPGAAFTPYGLLPWPETSVAGLRMDKDGGTWVQTPLPAAGDSKIQRTAKLKLSDEGDLEGKLTVTYSGLEALNRRVEERNQDTTERKKYLEDEVKEWVPAASEVELTTQPEWKSSSPSMVAEFSFKVPGWGTGAGKRMLLPVGLFTNGEKRVFDHAERLHPIYFEFPASRVDDVTIDLPAGWQVNSTAKDVDNDQHVASYKLTSSKGASSVHIQRSLVVDILLLDAKYYGALRNFFASVRSGDEGQAVLTPGEVKASN